MTPVQAQTSLPPKSGQEQARDLDRWFTVFWICMAVGLPTSFLIVGIAGLIAGVVFSCLILYKLWQLIPSTEAKTTPGKAVGFLFIPLFNFYWNFIGIYGLSMALNKQVQQRGLEDYRIDERLPLAYCIVFVVGFVLSFELPITAALFAAAQILLLIFALKQMKDAGKMLLINA